MGGLRVAPRTLSVECRLPLGKGDPPHGLRVRTEDAAVNITFVQGGAQSPKMGSWAQEAAGG